MIGHDLRTLGPARAWVPVGGADMVERERPGAVHVELAVPQRRVVHERRGLVGERVGVPGRDQARYEGVAARVIAGRPRERDPVRRLGQAEPVTVRLDMSVAAAGGREGGRGDLGKQPAGRVARTPVRVDRGGELVLGKQLHPVVGLAVHPVRLTADHIAHPGERQQVPLIGGIDEHLGPYHGAVAGHHRGEPGAAAADGDQRPPGVDRHLRTGEQAGHDSRGHPRLKGGLHRRRGSERAAVVGDIDSAVELAREATDGAARTDVGLAEPARCHTADVGGRFDDHNRATHTPHLYGGGDAGHGRAIYAQIRRYRCDRAG